MSEQDIEPTNDFRKIEAAPKENNDGPDVHEEALIRFKQIVSREEESRILGVEDLIFVDEEGGMHEEGTGFLSGDIRDTSNIGSEPPAPRYQIDRISPVIEEAVSDQRESQINIMVRATGEVTTGLNDTFNGLIKNIEVVSDAPDAYDNAYDECQKSGYGGWQIVTEYVEDSFENDIKIEPILNATQSLFFGPAKKATKEDALYAFHIWDMDMDEFKIQYPNAERTDWPQEIITGLNQSWFNSRDNLIRIAAYWRKKPIKKEIIQLNTGQVIDVEDLEAALQQPGVEIDVDSSGKEMRRKQDAYQVERFIMNGNELLKGPQKWAGKFIPLIPEYGIRSVINGREIIRGKVRKGKDAQRLYDYTVSAIIAATAKTPLDFSWITPAQAEGFIEDYDNANIDMPNFLYFNPDPDSPGPPVKSPGPTIQQALIDQRAQAKEDISASIGAGVGGVQDGTSADPRSGEAIREGNVNREKGNSIYFTNHIRAVAYTGVQLTDLISKLWTARRQRRIIKPDGTEEMVEVNRTMNTQEGEVIVNDLSQSAFDVIVDVGPAYASQRQQGADQLTKLATENPAFAQNTADLIADNLDIPGSRELSKRLRRAGILGGTIEPTDEEREEFQLDQRAQIAQELEPQIREQVTNEANIRLLDANTNQLNAQASKSNAGVAEAEAKAGLTAAEIEKTLAEHSKIMQESNNAAFDGMKKHLENIQKMFELGIPPSIREHDQRIQQSDIIDQEQQEVNPGPNSEQSEEFGLDAT